MKKGKLELNKLVVLILISIVLILVFLFMKNFPLLKDAYFKILDSFK